MSDFAWTPHYGTRKEVEPRTLTAKLGDGYEQRAADGLNHMPEIWTVVFTSVTHAKAAAIISFLEGKAGVAAFTFTPPEGAEIKVVCRKWPRTIKGPNLSSLTLTFKQVFDL